MFKKIRKSQSTLEYAILISIVAAAVVTFQPVMKRFLDAKYLDGLKFFNSQTRNVLGDDMSWEPQQQDSIMTAYESNLNVQEGFYNIGSTDPYKNIVENTQTTTSTVTKQ